MNLNYKGRKPYVLETVWKIFNYGKQIQGTDWKCKLIDQMNQYLEIMVLCLLDISEGLKAERNVTFISHKKNVLYQSSRICIICVWMCWYPFTSMRRKWSSILNFKNNSLRVIWITRGVFGVKLSSSSNFLYSVIYSGLHYLYGMILIFITQSLLYLNRTCLTDLSVGYGLKEIFHELNNF